MPDTTLYDRLRLILSLPVLVLLIGCGSSPIPLSVAGSQSSVTNSVGSPFSASSSIESSKFAGVSPVDVPSDATSQNVETPSTEATTQETGRISTSYDCQKLVGCWRDSFCGQRTLTLKADGSATMRLKLDLAGRLLYGKTLEFDMRWSLNESILSFEILTGRPADAARSAIESWGDAFDYRLELVDGEHLQGWDTADSVLYKLRRIESLEADDAERR